MKKENCKGEPRACPSNKKNLKQNVGADVSVCPSQETDNKNKGITLIALVVTIIVLLILAGVALKLITGGDGILGKAENAVKKTKEEAAKEKVELLLAEYNMEKITEGTSLEDFLGAKKTSKEIKEFEKSENREKEWKILVDGYWFEVDEDTFEVKTSAPPGPTPDATATIVTTGYVFQGIGNVEVKIDVTLPGELEGAEVTITPPEGISKVGENYAVSSNGTHNFIVIANKNGHEYRKTVYVTVDKILGSVAIDITNVKYNEFTINVNNNYPAEANVQYIYYVDNTAKTSKTVDKSYQVTELTPETEYAVKVEAYLPGASTPVAATDTVTTPELSYEISCIEDLEAMKDDLEANYKLTRSLDFKDRNSYTTEEKYNYYNVDANEDGNPDNSWIPIGNDVAPFCGNFNGNYHTIRNLYINSNETNQGLFGCVSSITIKQLMLMDVNFYCVGGGLVGVPKKQASISFERVGMSGKIEYSQSGFLGGFVSNVRSVDWITFEECVSQVKITAPSRAVTNHYTAAFAPTFRGTMKNCYSTGVISGTNNAGLYGQIMYGTAQNCYTLHVRAQYGRTPDTCYTSDTLPSEQTGFTGWDFENTWYMDTEAGRPRLQWERQVN